MGVGVGESLHRDPDPGRDESAGPTAHNGVFALIESLSAPVLLIDDTRRAVWVNASLRELLTAHNLPSNAQSLDLDAVFGAGTYDRLLAEGRVSASAGDQAHFTLRSADAHHPSGLRAVEWMDQSSERLAVRGFQRLMAAAMSGDLTWRIPAEGLDSLLSSVAESINTVIDAMQESIQDVVEVQSAVASGDLTRRMSGFYSGEFAALKDAINASGASMQRMVTQVGMVAREIAAAAEQIRRGNAQLVSDAETQSRAMDSVASSAEQITATVHQNAGHATQATRLASETHERAMRGQEVSRRAVKAMTAINESSQRIAETTELINEIAFQTNLLSLNAAVEAARVGHEGRGFAVVATEVRKLSQRSAQAAAKISRLTSQSIDRVGDGLALVGRSSRALEEILDASEKTKQVVRQIEQAGQEQERAIELVMRSAIDIQQTLVHNKMATEQVAGQSQIADTQAHDLLAAIAQFTVEPHPGSSIDVPTSATAPPPSEEPQPAADVSDDFFV